jgi:hypothetical protein
VYFETVLSTTSDGDIDVRKLDYQKQFSHIRVEMVRAGVVSTEITRLALGHERMAVRSTGL